MPLATGHSTCRQACEVRLANLHSWSTAHEPSHFQSMLTDAEHCACPTLATQTLLGCSCAVAPASRPSSVQHTVPGRPLKICWSLGCVHTLFSRWSRPMMPTSLMHEAITWNPCRWQNAGARCAGSIRAENIANQMRGRKDLMPRACFRIQLASLGCCHPLPFSRCLLLLTHVQAHRCFTDIQIAPVDDKGNVIFLVG